MTNQNNDASGVDINDALDLIETQDTQALLASHQAQLENLAADAPDIERYTLMLEIASDQLALEQHQAAWQTARTCFDYFIQAQHWQQAVESCDVMFQCHLDDSIIALANGIWLAVTFPISPQTSIAMLQHVIDETPANSDGAAVAAMTAHYIADMRAENEQADSLKFLTTQMIAQVAKRHSQIEDQEMLEFWIEKLELKEPSLFLPRLAKVLDVIIKDKWWYDRDTLRQLIPDN